ncbi:unnamed protein product [Pleuronectes platessa]|uniref:Uncharacterized protein n=1 Tax=Pleuronectes platessa TaxID=8262 RepID=A0A9N7VYL4_PLEPL|nr:unnamed protein product [Pleuronectes platessa]
MEDGVEMEDGGGMEDGVEMEQLQARLFERLQFVIAETGSYIEGCRVLNPWGRRAGWIRPPPRRAMTGQQVSSQLEFSSLQPQWFSVKRREAGLRDPVGERERAGLNPLHREPISRSCFATVAHHLLPRTLSGGFFLLH